MLKECCVILLLSRECYFRYSNSRFILAHDSDTDSYKMRLNAHCKASIRSTIYKVGFAFISLVYASSFKVIILNYLLAFKYILQRDLIKKTIVSPSLFEQSSL